MKVVLQRVQKASVAVEGQVIGRIAQGFLLLVGISHADEEKTADKMMDKICRLRIFEDDQGKTNCSLADVGGQVLVISQFTLYADCRKGNRPGFTGAGAPDKAKALYEYMDLRRAFLWWSRAVSAPRWKWIWSMTVHSPWY